MPGRTQRFLLRRRALFILVVLVHALLLYAWPRAQPLMLPAGATLGIVFVGPAPKALPLPEPLRAAPRKFAPLENTA